MSVLTKVFVVLLSLSSVALSMLVVGAFAQQQDWKEAAIGYKQSAASANAKAAAATAELAQANERARIQLGEASSNIEGLKGQTEAQASTIANLERQLADATNKLTVEQGQVTSVNDENKVILGALNHEKELSVKLAMRNKELELRNVDLNDRVKELTTNVEMARSQIRALQQQVASMEGTGGGVAARQIPGGPGIVESSVPSVSAPVSAGLTSPIRGEVTKVQGNLASISVGAADGVAPGMSFVIFRRAAIGERPSYLGTLKVTRVEANESAGLLEVLSGEIRVGDTARDEISLAKRG